MKLEKGQIYAIARKIKDQKESDAKAYNHKLKQDPKVVKEADRILKAIDSLPKDVKDHIKYKPSKYDVLDKLTAKKAKPTYYNLESIVTEVTIATIDVSSLDELKKKFKIEF